MFWIFIKKKIKMAISAEGEMDCGPLKGDPTTPTLN
jgi:hypothetical protein